MYLMPILVPIFVDGDRRLVATDWRRALLLLRDSLGGRYGDLVVLAPWLSASDSAAREQTLESLDGDAGLRLEPSVDARVRVGAFWRQAFRPYRAQLAGLLAGARVVHTGMDDLLRPLVELPLFMAFQRGVATVFVQDTDAVVQIRALAGPKLRQRARAVAYTTVLDRVGRAAAARADLSLLKGKQLMTRYAPHARNAREFHDTSYLLEEVVPEATVEARLAGLAGRPLRFVYCGRLVARKGVAESVELIRRARARGADVTLDLIGNGPEESALRDQIAGAALGASVRLLGARPYGPALLRDLAAYDALLFTPTAEDTPRMIFDGYAAGLPLVGAGIPYVQERADEEKAAIVLPADPDDAAARLAALDRRRSDLMPLTKAAHQAGRYHAADAWYRRRADWTHEAVARHDAA
jgi:glycosyltransferase involved in cell wall biosynthesis